MNEHSHDSDLCGGGVLIPASPCAKERGIGLASFPCRPSTPPAFDRSIQEWRVRVFAYCK